MALLTMVDVLQNSGNNESIWGQGMERVLIVGGGVIGMMQARELAQQGYQVTLLERGVCGREASWAGGGIISPLYPWRYAAAVTALARWSQQYYPQLVQDLEAESGMDPELSRHGLLVLAVADASAALAWEDAPSGWLSKVGAEEIYRLESGLAEGADSALWMPQVASVRNPRLLKALRRVLADEPNITVREQCAVEQLLLSGDRVRGVRTPEGDIEADQVIVTAGAWSAGVLSEVLPSLPIAPVRGQMLLFHASPGTLSRIVLKDGHYLIPRRDGSILAGSTLEYVGFDKTTTDVALTQLRDFAVSLLPALAKCEVAAHWAGLRPSSPNGVPFIGPVDDVKGLYVNAGHFRNGLVLAPAAVRLMTAYVTGLAMPIDAAPYLPNRLRRSVEA